MANPSNPQQDDAFLQEFFNFLRKSASRRGPQLADLPQEAFQKLYAQLKQKSNALSEEIEEVYRKSIEWGKEVMTGSNIKITVKSADIRDAQRSFRPKLIQGKAIFTQPYKTGSKEVDCFVTCGHWNRLGELKGDQIDIINYLPQLLPPPQQGSSKPPLGLVTFQNGIMNTLDEFRVMATSIISQFPEGPLCIGLYNQTRGSVLFDMHRFGNESELNPRSVYSFCQMAKTFAELIPTINPDLIWAHFAHSEGALIANAAFDLCEQPRLYEAKKFIKKHLITATYGAVKPIPDEPVLHVVNTYSNKDIALFCAKKYLDKDLDKIKEGPYTSIKSHKGKTYKITIVSNKTESDPLLNIEVPKVLTLEKRLEMSWLERLAADPDCEEFPMVAHTASTKIASKINAIDYAIKDHGFAEATYQAALIDNVKDLRKMCTVYDAKKFN